MKTIIDQQHQFFLTDVTKSYAFRKKNLEKLYQIIIDNETLIEDAFKKGFK